MDFTELLAVLTVGALTAGLTSAAAIKIVPGFVKWGYNKVINWWS